MSPEEAELALARLAATFPSFVFGYETSTGFLSTGFKGSQLVETLDE